MVTWNFRLQGQHALEIFFRVLLLPMQIWNIEPPLTLQQIHTHTFNLTMKEV